MDWALPQPKKLSPSQNCVAVYNYHDHWTGVCVLNIHNKHWKVLLAFNNYIDLVIHLHLTTTTTCPRLSMGWSQNYPFCSNSDIIIFKVNINVAS